MREYPYLYSQRDQAWASLELGTVQGATIGQYGCLLTCHAMKAGYYGHQIQPNALNDIYKQRNLYLSGDLLSDADIHAVFNDIQLIDTKDYSGIPADLSYIQQLANDPATTVTIEVDFDHDPNDGIQTHFVELHTYDGTTLTIYDPWYGTLDNFTLHYGTNIAQTIQRIAVYKGNPIKAPITVDPDVYTMLVTKATANDAVCDELSLSHDAGKDAEVSAIREIKSDKATAEQTVSTLNQQLPQLKIDNETLTGQIKTLQIQLEQAQQASVHTDSGIDYKTLYEQAEVNLTKANQATDDAVSKYNRAMGQYQNTSAYLLPPAQVLGIALARMLKIPVSQKS